MPCVNAPQEVVAHANGGESGHNRHARFTADVDDPSRAVVLARPGEQIRWGRPRLQHWPPTSDPFGKAGRLQRLPEGETGLIGKDFDRPQFGTRTLDDDRQ